MSHWKGKREAEKMPSAHEKVSFFSKLKAFYHRHEIACVIICGILALLLIAVLGVGLWWATNVKPPDIPVPDSSTIQTVPDSEQQNTDDEGGLGSLTEGVAINEELPDYIKNQKEGVYSFLLIGRTEMDDNADMQMLVIFDSNTGEIDACSIPRDTLINITSNARKINSTIWGGVDNLKNWVRKTLGVYPNFYVMVDWQGVGDMVEAVGGVYFDVPCRMYYGDSTKGHEFMIDLQEGYQKLNGNQAMQLIRWRKNAPGYTQYAYEAGFDGSDLKRTQMQQEFIVEAAKQILTVKNLPYLGSMIQVFTENVETDLSIGNLAWFAQKALELDSANKVEFHTLPSVAGSAYCKNTKNYQSYVTFQPSALVKMVNEYLNPYESAISVGNLDLMSINSDGTLSSTTGYVADSQHNQIINDINAGLAYFDSKYNVIYYETEEETTEGETTNPDGSVTNPDGTVTNPDGSMTNPDGTVTNPDGSMTNPDGTVTNPDGSMTNPGDTVTNPDGSVTNPDGTVTNPGASTENPDTPVTNPDSTTDPTTGNTTAPPFEGEAGGDGSTGTTDGAEVPPTEPTSPVESPVESPINP